MALLCTKTKWGVLEVSRNVETHQVQVEAGRSGESPISANILLCLQKEGLSGEVQD